MEKDYTREMLSKIRQLNEQTDKNKKLINEDKEENKSKAIAITDESIFGTNVKLEQLSKPNKERVEESPLIYQPKRDGNSGDNLIFSGTIPCLGNLQFQFKLRTNTGNGCFIWVDNEDGMNLTKENLDILFKLFGFYENWKEEWNVEASDLEKLAAHINDNI